MTVTTANSEPGGMTVADILPKIERLQSALEAQAPGIENYLSEINEDLRQYPELTFLLSDEEIAPIYAAILKKTNTVIAVKTAKKKGNKGMLDDGQMVADLL
jgi:hypothetical protein